MAFTRSPILRIALALTILALPVVSYGADLVGKAAGGGSAIDWQLNVSGHDSVTLSVVAPDGTVYQRNFRAGRTPSFRLLDLGGEVADGQYNYELRVNPRISADVRSKLNVARAKGDDAAVAKVMKDAGISAPVQSGTITILNGMIVTPGNLESRRDSATTRGISTDAVTPRPKLNPAVEVQVIADDLVVQGSGCFGFDCASTESFGVDTIRLKENNLRIHFDDTSTSAGFANNDWRLFANDQPSGGQNMFSINDATAGRDILKIEAGAPANAVYVDSTGRIGFSQSAPGLELHVTDSDSPGLRLEQTSAGGFTAQTWDIAGNEANFFVRDLTGGSKLSFRIRPGAPTSSIDIAADGEVGIGTASPEAKLHVFGTNTTDTFIGIGADPDGSTGNESAMTLGYSGATFGRASGFFNVRPDSGATAPNPSLRFATGNTVRVLIDNEGFIGLGDTASAGTNPTSPIQYTNGAVTARLTTAGAWQDASSRKGKENIHSLSAEAAFDALKTLEPVAYNYKVMPDDPKVGFIAEDVPELVAAPDREGLSALDIVAVVTRVVKEQQKTIEELNARIAELEKSNQ
jgi:Chaperone of endosialidase